MPWLKRKHNRYYYQTIKSSDGQYRMKYTGVAGSTGAIRAEKEDEARRKQKALSKQSNQELSSLIADLDRLRSITDLMVRTYLLLNGTYLRKSEIRTIRRPKNE